MSNSLDTLLEEDIYRVPERLPISEVPANNLPDLGNTPLFWPDFQSQEYWRAGRFDAQEAEFWVEGHIFVQEVHSGELGQQGQACRYSKVLMKVLWAARLARYDLLKAVSYLARFVTRWLTRCDEMLHRLK